MSAQVPDTIEILDAMMALIPVIMVVTALLAAVAVRIVGRPGRDTASADDPYFYPIGDAPVLPHQVSASALLRNESGGCQSPRSSAAALTSSEGAQHV